MCAKSLQGGIRCCRCRGGVDGAVVGSNCRCTTSGLCGGCTRTVAQTSSAAPAAITADALPAPPAATGAAGAPTTLKALPAEVLAVIVGSLTDHRDRAAFARSFAASRDAVAAMVTGLCIPAAVLLLPPQMQLTAGMRVAPLPTVLLRHCSVERLSITPLAEHAAAVFECSTRGRAAGVGTLLSALPLLARLVSINLASAPPAVFESLPSPLLRTLAMSCPQLQQLQLSANLWHTPAQAVVLRAMAQIDRRGTLASPQQQAALAAGAADCACPSSHAAAAAPAATRPAFPAAAAVAGNAMVAPAIRHAVLSHDFWRVAAASAPASIDTAVVCAAQLQQQRLHLIGALLAQALPAQAAIEDLRYLAPLRSLTLLTISDPLPSEVLHQLPGLPATLQQLSLDCFLQHDDGKLGMAIGGVRGLSCLTLFRLPSFDGALFKYMSGG